MISMTDRGFEEIRKRHGMAKAVNRFVEEHGVLPTAIAESEIAGELKDDPGLSEQARRLL